MDTDRRRATRQPFLLPTTPITAPEYGSAETDADLLDTIACTSPFDPTGHPALSIPRESGGDDPVGCRFVADWFDEATAVTIGQTLER
ncbi:MAG: aspartyl-tRNA(Asn)/glutamyl-tRNA(Gln) amidotransferase subunit A [Natronomonas sp.]|jgi:aspartyl-tRNA(Asn)/glutamyl-tRNA(Gln) amidotransferase subunit A